MNGDFWDHLGCLQLTVSFQVCQVTLDSFKKKQRFSKNKYKTSTATLEFLARSQFTPDITIVIVKLIPRIFCSEDIYL